MKCPECGNNVAENIKVCPDCGYEIITSEFDIKTTAVNTAAV